MKNRTLVLAMSLVLVTSIVPHAVAGEAAEPDVRDIIQQQTQIRHDIESSPGRYRDLSPEILAEVKSRQDRVLERLDGKESVEQLSDAERMQAFNDLEWIEAALNHERGDEMVCKQERRTGSNRLQRVCRTAAQIQQDKEGARGYLDRLAGKAARQ